MATASAGDRVTISVKNTFLDFTPSEAEESNTLRRSLSEGMLSCRSSPKNNNNTTRKIYTWLPSGDVVSIGDSIPTMSRSFLASCARSQMWWLASGDGSVGDATMTTMPQVSSASCDSSSRLSSAKMRPAPHAPRAISDLINTQVLKHASFIEDVPLTWCSHLVKALHEESGVAVEVIQKLEREGVLGQIPRNDEGEITSIGSLKHSLGTCTPCIFWFRGNCRNSLSCMFCHLRHPGQKGKRHKPNKRARQLMRQLKMNRDLEVAMDGQSKA
eukprot:TRINITY_DN72649_c0_g1_i1.p1 TRINITY_DN72649_c0_g1~~TRINITY_DN72649_c0_g1_i1.p1  ORF type:complete len:272 (-),score=32.65 TRINITY_DN72649_c0_g1_i1:249-1064(-)